jgi:hypothetical protein
MTANNRTRRIKRISLSTNSFADPVLSGASSKQVRGDQLFDPKWAKRKLLFSRSSVCSNLCFRDVDEAEVDH